MSTTNRGSPRFTSWPSTTCCSVMMPPTWDLTATEARGSTLPHGPDHHGHVPGNGPGGGDGHRAFFRGLDRPVPVAGGQGQEQSRKHEDGGSGKRRRVGEGSRATPLRTPLPGRQGRLGAREGRPGIRPRSQSADHGSRNQHPGGWSEDRPEFHGKTPISGPERLRQKGNAYPAIILTFRILWIGGRNALDHHHGHVVGPGAVFPEPSPRRPAGRG